MALSTTDFELLLQANRILSSKLDVEEVLQTVMELATKVVRAEASSLLLLDGEKNELYFDVALGSVKESVKQIRLKVGEGIAGWVAKTRQPLIVNDVTKDPRFTSKVDKSTRFKTRSLLAVPMLAKGRLIGVVEALNKEHNRAFSQQDLEAFELFGSQAAIAIENARLFSEALREKEKLNTVFAQMSDGVLLLDKEGKLLLINAAGRRWLGFKPLEAIGKKFGYLFPDFEVYPYIEDLTALKQEAVPLELVRRKSKNFSLSGVLLKLESTKESSQEGFLVILRDTTEEKREERLKRNFLSLISHKLKTPLTVILGYAPALQAQMDGLTDIQKKAVQAISSQGERLGELVDKLLRFAIVESDSVKKNIESRSVASLIKQAVESVQASVEDGQKVSIQVEPGLEGLPPISVDGNLTVEVFKNLIDNGIKFNKSPKKEIAVSARKGKNTVMIEVKDNGVGIPPEEQEKVFQKFYQVENSFTGQVPGAGLGLTLCKKVVEEMGGKIRLESAIGKGTKIAIILPTK